MDGSVQYVAYYEENDRPDSKDVIEGIIKGNRQRASRGEIKASGIAWMSSITTADKKTCDVIVVSLEHKDGYSVMVGRPYKLGLFKKVSFGELFVMEGKHDIF